MNFCFVNPARFSILGLGGRNLGLESGLMGGVEVPSSMQGSSEFTPVCCITLEPLLCPNDTLTPDVVAVIQQSSTISKQHAVHVLSWEPWDKWAILIFYCCRSWSALAFNMDLFSTEARWNRSLAWRELDFVTYGCIFGSFSIGVVHYMNGLVHHKFLKAQRHGLLCYQLTFIDYLRFHFSAGNSFFSFFFPNESHSWKY
jgi:hypothetical protein